MGEHGVGRDSASPAESVGVGVGGVALYGGDFESQKKLVKRWERDFVAYAKSCWKAIKRDKMALSIRKKNFLEKALKFETIPEGRRAEFDREMARLKRQDVDALAPCLYRRFPHSGGMVRELLSTKLYSLEDVTIESLSKCIINEFAHERMQICPPSESEILQEHFTNCLKLKQKWKKTKVLARHISTLGFTSEAEYWGVFTGLTLATLGVYGVVEMSILGGLWCNLHDKVLVQQMRSLRRYTSLALLENREQTKHAPSHSTASRSVDTVD
ncbi:hypothetical protein Pelo_10761 [Pelomyxa schiedti]|nr:hypothetical protein Pelo_10761 [Pelomyxa schiedti]